MAKPKAKKARKKRRRPIRLKPVQQATVNRIYQEWVDTLVASQAAGDRLTEVCSVLADGEFTIFPNGPNGVQLFKGPPDKE